MYDQRRNHFLFFMDTVLFVNAMTFLSVNAIITYFLANLQADTFEIGLVNALVSIGSFISQPLFAKLVMNLSHKAKMFAKILFIQRISFLLVVAAVPLFAESRPQLMVLVFLIGWAIFNLFVGSYNIFYMSLFAKLVTPNARGRLRGFSSGAGSVFALGSAALCGVLLTKVPFPYNYTVIFAAGVALLLLDVLMFRLMKEHEADEVAKVNFNYFQYFKAVPLMFREFPQYKRTVAGFAFIVASHSALAYYTLYAVRTFEAGSTTIALFTAITGLANIAGSVIFGIMADRIGHRHVLMAAAIAGGLGSLLIVSFHGLWSVYAAFALTNICIIGYNLSGSVFILEQIPRSRLPMAISINSMFSLCTSSVVLIGSSWVADYLSFQAVFLFTGLCGIAGFFIVRGRQPALSSQQSSHFD
ncbi:MFS transporter [Paenibacillus thalictri]|uniref:MFS transporter n=1 Tax=Paenibacillus thalictri TaxID=2527873 RepID=A0A4Q9DUE3_9BACL|nr:MFS transporter [Paenibacillus thalictri]TBL79028.1 MFS transporter [Paenibacillus thalictri]